MGRPNRVIEFLPPSTPIMAPSGRKPSGSGNAVDNDRPGVPKDLLEKLITPAPDGRRSDRRFKALRQARELPAKDLAR